MLLFVEAASLAPRATHACMPHTCLCRGSRLLRWAPICGRKLSSTLLPILLPLQRIQVLGEDGMVANVTAGDFRSCGGGSVFVVDGPLT